MGRILKITGVLFLSILLILIYLGYRTPSLPSKYGKLDMHLFLGDQQEQTLVIAFGGGSGGNDWERKYLKEKRDEFLARGFAVLAIGYFNSDQSPETLDRISLNAISDSIISIANRNPQLDTSRMILMGASKGGELVLNLASRFPHFKGVVALSTSHVSFPAHTISANTSSWNYNDQEVRYVPAPISTLGAALKGDLFGAFSIMLEDTTSVEKAEIEVEKINGPILIISGNQDDQWPATYMSRQIMKRLAKNNFKHSYQHIELEGGHIEPLNQFDQVVNFLEKECGFHSPNTIQ